MKHILFSLLTYCVLACSPQVPTRVTTDFTEAWKFHLGDVSNAQQTDLDDSQWRTVDVPHDWSIEADFSLSNPATPGGGALPGGIGWYRKEFNCDKADQGKSMYIQFDGVYWNSTVWINGQLLGNRPSGYISFQYDITPHLKYGERNVIAVKVDNSLQPNSRWYSGSGIYRNVNLLTVNTTHVDQWGTYVTTPSVNSERAEVKAITKIKNNANDPKKVELVSTIIHQDGREVAKTSKWVDLTGEITEIDQTLEVEKPQLWSIEQPYLYTLITEIKSEKELLDRYETPIGIRYFEFDTQKGFFLNGQSMKIKGVCNHHDLGCLGTAVNVRALERQLEILKAMGCNAIRTSHNPPAPELLDLCDKMGFLVQDEAFDMWRKRKSAHDYSQYFPEWHERDLTDLVVRDRNHPSVFMWSIGNEILEQWSHVDADTLNLQQANMILNFANTLKKPDIKGDELHVNSLLTIKLADMVKQLDPSRPVTTGNNETSPNNHILRAGAMDVIGFNYHENDWEGFHDKFPNQKLIISESTSALMSRGYYQMPSDSIRKWPVRWDLPFDQPIHHCSAYDNCHAPWGSTHEKSWQMTKKQNSNAGLFVWTGFDYLGEPTPFWWPSRSSYFGIIDLAGFPKDVYYMYQSEWTTKDVLHVFPHWNWSEGQTVDVWAYYNNADEVELYLNEVSLGKRSKTADELHVWWRVKYTAGALKAVSRKSGKEVLSTLIQTAGDPVSIRLTPDRSVIKADGKDLSFVTVEMLDAKGNVVPTANNLVQFSVQGGTIVGTDNGDQTDPVSLSKPDRHLFNGKALVVLKGTKKAGHMQLTATSGTMSATQDISTHD